MDVKPIAGSFDTVLRAAGEPAGQLSQLVNNIRSKHLKRYFARDFIKCRSSEALSKLYTSLESFAVLCPIVPDLG